MQSFSREEWTEDFNRWCIKAGYSSKSEETDEMYNDIVKFMSEEHLNFVIYGRLEGDDGVWYDGFVNAVKNEILERTLLQEV